MKKSQRIFTQCTFGFFLLYCTSVSAQFSEYPSRLPNIKHSSVAWGDFDDDNDLDIFLMGWNGEKRISKVFVNEKGRFSECPSSITGVNSTVCNNFAWGDYDNDGDVDLLITGQNGSKRIAELYKNVGKQSLVREKVLFPGLFATSVCWGDYDADGDLDILMSGKNADNIRVSTIFQNQEGKFVASDHKLLGVSDGNSAWGDYDNDGDLDLIITGRDNSKIRKPVSKIYQNDKGRFVDIQANIAQISRSSVAWGDYDNDQDLDLLLCGLDKDNSPITAIYQNNSGNFIRIPTQLPQVSRGAVAWGDCDNDGDLDILITGSTLQKQRISKIYQNLGRGLFADIKAPLQGVSSGSVAWGDFDNDGDLDVLICGEDQEFRLHTRLYENKINKPSTLEAPPQNLKAVFNENETTLSWAASSSKIQTYNVRVGTQPNASDIVSSMANIETGFRKVAERGNASSNKKFILKNLPSGTYYWSVQSINSAFLGSAFAPESRFEIP